MDDRKGEVDDLENNVEPLDGGNMLRQNTSFMVCDESNEIREPLLRRKTMNTTSQIAIIGANVCPIESLDYEILENDLFKQDWRSRKQVQIFQYVVLKWTLALLIGLSTGLVGFFNNLAVENIAGFKLLLTSDLMLSNRWSSYWGAQRTDYLKQKKKIHAEYLRTKIRFIPI